MIVASAGRLFGATRLKPVVRIAVLEATVAVMIAALLLLPDIGRPDRAWHLLRYAHVTSPLIWDLTIVTVYFVISATYVWVYTRADLARARQPARARHGYVARADMRRDELLKGVLAAVGLPAAILLHSITAWIFGLQIARGFWYSAIMAPLFIASALVSGTALMILLALIVRRTGQGRLQGRPGGATSAACWRCSSPSRRFSCSRRCSPPRTRGGLRGRTCPAAAHGPLRRLLLVRGARRAGRPVRAAGRAAPARRRRWVAVASVLAVAGILIHRVNIVLNGLSYATVPYPPGVSDRHRAARRGRPRSR